MPDTENPARLKACVQGARRSHLATQPGRWFRETMLKLGRFGREELKLSEKVESAYVATWARVEGAIVGKDPAEALLKWREAEIKRIEAKLMAETLTEKVEQEHTRTEQIKAETERTRAEAAKLRAEAFKIQVEAAIALVDRLAAAKLWVVPDGNGGVQLVPRPEDADTTLLYSRLIPSGLLDFRPTPLGDSEIPAP